MPLFREGGHQAYAERLKAALEESLEGLRTLDEGRKLLGGLELEDGTLIHDSALPTIKKMERDPLGYREVIDDYISLIHECWRHGFSESTFNFTASTGYTDGKMIIINPAELAFSKQKVRSQIKNRKWENQATPRWDLRQVKLLSMLKKPGRPEPVRKHFLERARNGFTEDKLDKLWNSEA